MISYYPEVRPRIISDNGPQWHEPRENFPYYPQSNGKIERWHQSLKTECIRPGTPLSLDDARRLVAHNVEHYNTFRLHSAIGYVTPHDMLDGRQ